MILQCTESFQETDLKFLIETAFFTVEIEYKTGHFFSYQTCTLLFPLLLLNNSNKVL
jgi:hypothetical protein